MRVGILTEDFGLVYARVGGVRNNSSKLRSGSQEFAYGDFSLISGKTGWRLVGVRIQTNFFEKLKVFREKAKVMASVSLLLRKLLFGEEKDQNIFEIVLDFFEFLISAKPEEVAPSECITVMKVLNILGFLRSDPEFIEPLALNKLEPATLSIIASRRARMINLINESLSATHVV